MIRSGKILFMGLGDVISFYFVYKTFDCLKWIYPKSKMDNAWLTAFVIPPFSPLLENLFP